MFCTLPFRGRDSSVGIATSYGLDGPGIESRWGRRDFRHLSRTAHPASYTMGTGSFPGVKRRGRGVDHPPPSSADVKERVELYLYIPSRSSWPVLGWTLPLPLPVPFHLRWISVVGPLYSYLKNLFGFLITFFISWNCRLLLVIIIIYYYNIIIIIIIIIILIASIRTSLVV
jgi:hypothetical protein